MFSVLSYLCKHVASAAQSVNELISYRCVGKSLCGKHFSLICNSYRYISLERLHTHVHYYFYGYQYKLILNNCISLWEDKTSSFQSPDSCFLWKSALVKNCCDAYLIVSFILNPLHFLKNKQKKTVANLVDLAISYIFPFQQISSADPWFTK